MQSNSELKRKARRSKTVTSQQVDSRVDIIFKGAERAMSKIVNLRQYKVGGAAHIAEERKVKEYSKLWDIEDTTRNPCELAFLRS
jgi:hypothetical protein